MCLCLLLLRTANFAALFFSVLNDFNASNYTHQRPQIIMYTHSLPTRRAQKVLHYIDSSNTDKISTRFDFWIVSIWIVCHLIEYHRALVECISPLMIENNAERYTHLHSHVDVFIWIECQVQTVCFIRKPQKWFSAKCNCTAIQTNIQTFHTLFDTIIYDGKIPIVTHSKWSRRKRLIFHTILCTLQIHNDKIFLDDTYSWIFALEEEEK